MSPPIEACPPEVVESIVRYLSLSDICSLRLSNHFLAANATQDTFKSYFLTKHVDLNKDSLERFVQITNSGSLSCLVEHLILVGIAIDLQPLEKILKERVRWVTTHNGPMWGSTQHQCSGEELAQVEANLQVLKEHRKKQWQFIQSGLDIALLSDAFRNLRSNGIQGKLQSISLEVVVYREDVATRQEPLQGGKWQTIWQSAANAFCTTAASLARSNLAVGKIDVFNSTLRCSLGCRALGCLEDFTENLAAPLRELKTLSLSLSDTLFPDSEIEMSKRPQAPERHFAGLATLLDLTPQLEELHLHWYAIDGTDGVDVSQPARLFQSLGQSTQLPPLKLCNLRGIPVHEDPLLNFLRRVPIQSLLIENVHLQEGTWQPIFDHCTSAEARMDHLYFDDLWEQQLIYFDESSVWKFAHSGNPGGGLTLERWGFEVRKAIRYHYSEERILGSPQAYNWSQLRRRDYGPAQ